jgi:hypothetical protein
MSPSFQRLSSTSYTRHTRAPAADAYSASNRFRRPRASLCKHDLIDPTLSYRRVLRKTSAVTKHEMPGNRDIEIFRRFTHIQKEP